MPPLSLTTYPQYMHIIHKLATIYCVFSKNHCNTILGKMKEKSEEISPIFLVQMLIMRLLSNQREGHTVGTTTCLQYLYSV